jgi:DNA modification methylase
METPRFQLAHGDAVAWLRTLPAGSVDLVVTDPPYESLEKHRAIGTTTRLKHSKASSNDWFSIFPNARFPELFAEVYRVLKKDTHFYLYCDPETMFVAKPMAEAAGFKFWKPIIWDKCLGPDTLVWTRRGVVKIAEIVVGDRVALPDGGTTAVRATRRTRSPSVRLQFSDGTSVIASRDHRFQRADGTLVEAGEMKAGDAVRTRPVREEPVDRVRMDDVIPESDAVFELPPVDQCLWCGERFQGSRAAAAHQARWCRTAASKKFLAAKLGIRPKRLRRWMDQGRMPLVWARELGLESKLGGRVQCALQNDIECWYPPTLELNYELGKVIGLYAAEGSMGPTTVSFAFHRNEKHLHASISRFARSLGLNSHLKFLGDGARVDVNYKVMQHLMRYFIGGKNSLTKFFRPALYAAPAPFRQGAMQGLIEGDGHWSHKEQRETYVSASPDLAMFVRREAAVAGLEPSIRRFENRHCGGWKVRFDPKERKQPTTVTAIEDLGMQDLVDISIEHRDELFLLSNGVVTHNCNIGMGYHYRARYECILFFEKGKRKLNDLGVADILEAPRINGGYPAEKPPAISETLITQSTEAGQLVIDPFMGSGSVGFAAISKGRNFLGNDLCKEAVDITRSRLLETHAVEGKLATAEPSKKKSEPAKKAKSEKKPVKSEPEKPAVDKREPASTPQLGLTL